MKLQDFDSTLDAGRLEDSEVVGVQGGLVIYFDAVEGTVYNDGTPLDKFIDTGEGWHMTPAEAARVGITDYPAYEQRRIASLEAAQDARAPEMAL